MNRLTYPRDVGERDAAGAALERGVGALLGLDDGQQAPLPRRAVHETHLLRRGRRHRVYVGGDLGYGMKIDGTG